MLNGPFLSLIVETGLNKTITRESQVPTHAETLVGRKSLAGLASFIAERRAVRPLAMNYLKFSLGTPIEIVSVYPELLSI